MTVPIIVALIVTALSGTAVIGSLAGGAVMFIQMLRSKDRPLSDPVWVLVLLIWPLAALIFYLIRGRVW